MKIHSSNLWFTNHVRLVHDVILGEKIKYHKLKWNTYGISETSDSELEESDSDDSDSPDEPIIL